VELPSGRYLALCRFEPSNVDGWEEVSESPLLIEVPLEVRPGAEQFIRNGPASVAILGQNQPSLALIGKTKGSLEGVEFWRGPLAAKVEVPADWLQSEEILFEIRVLHGEHRAVLPVHLDDLGSASVLLDSAIADLQLEGGLWRLVLEFARAGEARTLQRQSVLYWSGLRDISYGLRFTFDRSPKNLIVSSSAGVKVGVTQIEPSDDSNRFVRMVFDVGGGRLVHLSWHRPGIFVEVQVPGADGSATAVARPLGASETVSLNSAKTVLVTASEPGYITLGSMRTFVDFSQRASKAFPASFLASRLEAGACTLSYETLSSSVSVPLLVLSHPHVATDLKTEHIANQFETRIALGGEPTDISVQGLELSSGRKVRAEHELMAGTWHTNEVARMQVYSAPTGSSYVLHVLIDIESLKPGVWIFEFGARVGGVWGRMQDSGEGRIAVVLAVDAMGKEFSGKTLVEGAADLELAEAATRLLLLNEHFRQHWSAICWEQHPWLTLYFSALVERLKDHEGEVVTDLVDMAMSRPTDDVRQGFLSMQLAPAWLYRVFSLQRASYKRVNIRAHPLSIALRAMPELKGSVSPAFGVVLHPAAAMPFKNRAEVMQGRRPRGFSLVTYREALEQTKLGWVYQLDDEHFLPKEGELLGPLHLAHAWRDLERGFTSSQLMPTNRKSAAIALARKLSLHCGVFDQSAPVGLKGQALVIKMGRSSNDPLEETEQFKWEQMENIAHACSLLAWNCRLEQRQSGAITSFVGVLGNLRKQVEVPGGGVPDCIAFYLQVAPAMFAFYLLLWELVLTIELDLSVQNV